MKFDDTPSREEREDFWLDLGPASAYEGLDCCETARRDGDASPDGLAHGFEGRRKPGKTSWPRPTTTRTANRCRICRPS